MSEKIVDRPDTLSSLSGWICPNLNRKNDANSPVLKVEAKSGGRTRIYYPLRLLSFQNEMGERTQQRPKASTR